jgi:hypothetical protein
MPQKVFIFLLLINLINTTLLFQEVHAIGFCDKKEEINSLVELIEESQSDIPDKTPEDEDDDIPDYFNLEKNKDHFIFFNTCLFFNTTHSSIVNESLIVKTFSNNIYTNIITSLGYYLHLGQYTPF